MQIISQQPLQHQNIASEAATAEQPPQSIAGGIKLVRNRSYLCEAPRRDVNKLSNASIAQATNHTSPKNLPSITIALAVVGAVVAVSITTAACASVSAARIVKQRLTRGHATTKPTDCRQIDPQVCLVHL